MVLGDVFLWIFIYSKGWIHLWSSSPNTNVYYNRWKHLKLKTTYIFRPKTGWMLINWKKLQVAINVFYVAPHSGHCCEEQLSKRREVVDESCRYIFLIIKNAIVQPPVAIVFERCVHGFWWATIISIVLNRRRITWRHSDWSPWHVLET